MHDTAPRRFGLAPPAPSSQSVAPPASLSAGGVPRLVSAQIFGQGSEVHIEHGGAVYRLRITSLGKLILTK